MPLTIKRSRARLKAIEPDDIGPPFDLVLLAPRSHVLAAALKAAQAAIDRDTVVVPLIEGAGHFENPSLRAEARLLVGAVFEARLAMDADGRIHHRLPGAEIAIGALQPADQKAVFDLVSRLSGRGLTVLASDRIRSKTWERFGFLVAGIASVQVIGCPLQDALRSPIGAKYFREALVDCIQVGEVAGFVPNVLTARRYERAIFYEGAPVQAPPMHSTSGRASDEAGFLLKEMARIASAASVRLPWLDDVLMQSIAPGATSIPWTERMKLAR